LVTALLSLGFAVWLGIELRHQSKVTAPLAGAAASMNASINQSLAALRGWVAYGQPTAREERAAIWAGQIEPTLEQLEALSAASANDEVQTRISELREVLKQLKIIQWAIEDVAQTPGNQPASVAYELLLSPLRQNVLKSLRAALEQYSTLDAGVRRVDYVTRLAHFRAAFSEADLALSRYVTDPNEPLERSMRQRLARAREGADLLSESASQLEEGDLMSLLQFALGEFRAYDIQVQQIVALRRSAAGSIAQLLFVEEAQPLVLRARAISGELAESQARASQERSQVLTRGSFVVIGMSLLMGLLSGGSLLVSYRLKRQVQNVLARAKRLGQYEIERRIGKGGMGEVYLAHHAMLRRPTAIKLLRAESARDLRAQNRFQREVQLTCQLTHPNTIEIFDYGRTPAGIFYYAMEYVDGFTLESLVELVGPVSPSRVICILVQVCGSLQEAHDHGLLHRDIKPSNIMLTRKGGVYDTAKILDFGLVKDLADAEAAGGGEQEIIAGTPMYLAPEAILSAESVSARSDIYALGGVAYFMLTGRTVFDSGEVVQILSQQLGDEVAFPSERLGRSLPEDLECVVMSCLAKDPADRPESAAHLARLLEACECTAWTAEDARLWWEEYGEAARNADGTATASGSGVGDELEVVVDASRV
jgi:hypothetical protein